MAESSPGQRIAAARKARGMSQEALARAIDVSGQTVSRWERDAYLPDEVSLPKLATVLGMAPAEIEYGAVPVVGAVVELHPDVLTVARMRGLDDAEAQRLGTIRQSIGSPSIERLHAYASDIIEARGAGRAALPHNAARDRAEAEPSRVKPGRTPLRR